MHDGRGKLTAAPNANEQCIALSQTVSFEGEEDNNYRATIHVDTKELCR